MSESAPASPHHHNASPSKLGSLVAVNDSDEVSLRIFFLDNTFQMVTITEDTTIYDLHKSVVEKLRNTPVADQLTESLLEEFAIFVVSEETARLATPHESVINVLEASFQQDEDRFEFRRLIYPSPVVDVVISPSSLVAILEASDHLQTSGNDMADSTASSHTRTASQSKSAKRRTGNFGTGSTSNTDRSGTSSTSETSDSDGGVVSGSESVSSVTSTPSNPRDFLSPTDKVPSFGHRRSRSSSIPNPADLARPESPGLTSPKATPSYEPSRAEKYSYPLPSNTVDLWLEFHTCVSLVHTNLLFKTRSVKELFELAALQVLVAIKKEGGSGKQRIKVDLDRYFPPRFHTLVKPNIAREQILATYGELKLLSSEKAQQEYVSVVQRWRYYGTQFFFDCKCTDKKISSKAVVLGLNEDGVVILKAKDGDPISFHPFGSILSWCSSLSSISFEAIDRPTDSNDNENTSDLAFETHQGDLIAAVLQAYVDKKWRQLVTLNSK